MAHLGRTARTTAAWRTTRTAATSGTAWTAATAGAAIDAEFCELRLDLGKTGCELTVLGLELAGTAFTAGEFGAEGGRRQGAECDWYLAAG